MRARAIVASVSFLASALGCVTTQDLGAPPPGDDTGPGPSAASDPRGDLQSGSLPGDVEACPLTAPNPNDDCSEVKIARECNYEVRSFEEVADHVCGRSCVCALDGKWRCVAAPCPSLDPSTCTGGTACVGEMRCWGPCDGPGATCVSCECVHGRLSCTQWQRPPR